MEKWQGDPTRRAGGAWTAQTRSAPHLLLPKCACVLGGGLTCCGRKLRALRLSFTTRSEPQKSIRWIAARQTARGRQAVLQAACGCAGALTPPCARARARAEHQHRAGDGAVCHDARPAALQPRGVRVPHPGHPQPAVQGAADAAGGGRCLARPAPPPPARPPARPRTSAAAPTPGVAQELIIARCVPRALDRPALPHAPAAALAQGPAHRASQDRDGAAACTHSLSGG